MNGIKKYIATIVFAFSALGSNAAHAGIPVIDVAALAQAIQQVMAWGQQYQQMVQQYQQMLQQYQQLQQTYNSLNGIRNLGDVMNNPALKGIVPTDVGTVYTAINQAGAGSLSGVAQGIRTASKLYNCEDRTGADKTNCEAILSINAQSQAYEKNAMQIATDRVSQIQSLQSLINTTTDPKAIAELQARIAGEQAQIQNDANRLAVMKSMAETQMQAAEQARKERTMKMLASNAPESAASFTYVTP